MGLTDSRSCKRQGVACFLAYNIPPSSEWTLCDNFVDAGRGPAGVTGKAVALAMDIPVADRRMVRIRSRPKEMGTVQEPLIGTTAPSGLGLGETCRTLSRTALVRTCLCLGLIVAAALVGTRFSSTNIEPFQHDAFITITGTQFVHKCRPFYVVGFNVENLAEAMMARPGRAIGPGSTTGIAMIREVLQTAAGAGLNTLRTWAHTTNPEEPLQVRPGLYDEGVFSSLDVVIAEAERAGLRVILSLVDNWKYEGGVDEMVDWSGTAPKRAKAFPAITGRYGDVDETDWEPERREYEAKRKALFFVDEGAKSIYKNHVKTIINRVNTVTGRRYGDDATILAYDLLNEPRCLADYTPDCAARVGSWVKEMAEFIKSLDPNHLVTTGADGFWELHDRERIFNPGESNLGGSSWAAVLGQDFVGHHKLVDFATIHTWPDHWQWPNASFVASWITSHVRSAEKRLRKPVLVEEFGKGLELGTTTDHISSIRNPVFRTVYDETERLLEERSALAGTLFWRWGFNAWNPLAVGEYGVTPADSTFPIIKAHAGRVRALQNTAPLVTSCSVEIEQWVGVSRLGLARCQLLPRTGTRYMRTAMQHDRPGVETFPSHAECCLPGLGAFREGCHARKWYQT